MAPSFFLWDFLFLKRSRNLLSLIKGISLCVWVGMIGFWGQGISQEGKEGRAQESKKEEKPLFLGMPSPQRDHSAQNLASLETTIDQALGSSLPQKKEKEEKNFRPGELFKATVEIIFSNPHEGIRKEAIARAKNLGFEKVWLRLAVAQRVPVLSEGHFQDLIESVKILEEKITHHTYKGIFQVSFIPDKIRKLLKENQIGHSETVSLPILVLPLYKVGESTFVFEEKNTWRQAWVEFLKERQKEGTLLQFKLIEKETLPPTIQELLDQDVEKVVLYLMKQKGSYFMVSQMVLMNSEESLLELKLNQVTIDQEGCVSRLAPVTYESSRTPLRNIMKKSLKNLGLSWDEQWKKGTLLKEEAQEIMAHIHIEDMEDWTVIREKFKEVPQIREYKFMVLRPSEIQILINYAGDITHLLQGLARYGIGGKRGGDKLILSLKKETKEAHL